MYVKFISVYIIIIQQTKYFCSHYHKNAVLFLFFTSKESFILLLLGIKTKCVVKTTKIPLQYLKLYGKLFPVY